MVDNKSRIPELMSHLRDIEYEKKVEIYDKKCNGCGFAHIILRNDSPRSEDFVTNRIEEALHLARAYDLQIIRCCNYPNNDELISLSEIIMNGCILWNTEKIIQNTIEPTEFIEVSSVEELDVNIETRLSV